LQIELKEEFKKSTFIATALDTSPDICGKDALIIYAKFSNENLVKRETFLKIIYPDKTTGEQLYNELATCLQEFEINEKLFGIGTDGCSVMTGKNKGLISRAKTQNPYIIDIHCICHRLDLGVKDLTKVDPDIKILNNLVFKLCGYFQLSSKRLKFLSETESDELGFTLQLIKPIDVR
jgi:hypothetical protein